MQLLWHFLLKLGRKHSIREEPAETSYGNGITEQMRVWEEHQPENIRKKIGSYEYQPAIKLRQALVEKHQEEEITYVNKTSQSSM